MKKTDKQIKKKISKDMKISDIINTYPEVVELLATEWGFHCVSCFFSSFDTLEQGAKIHGITGKDLNLMVKMCNEIIQNGSSITS